MSKAGTIGVTGSEMKAKRAGYKPGLLGLIWPLLCAAILQAALVFFSLEVLLSVRAYINGESMWSKGQKDAVYFLGLYADSRDEAHYQRYLDAIALPLGDLRGRLAMEAENLDYEEAYAGLRAGGNHPDDIRRVIWLFRNFRQFDLLDRMVRTWVEADESLLTLQQLGKNIHGVLHDTDPETWPDRDAWKNELYTINERLTPLTWAFSGVLAETSRKVTSWLIVLNLTVGLMMVALAVLATRKLILQREKVEGVLRSEQARAQTTLAALGDAVLAIDERGRLDYMNLAAEQLVQWHGDKARHKPLGELFQLLDEHGQDDGFKPVEKILRGELDSTMFSTRQLLRVDGTKVMVSLVMAPIRLDNGAMGAVLVLHDITRERQYVANLTWQASHDALTGLVNRREFERRLARAIKRLQETPGQHALLYLDFDQFKIVNDTCGHAIGDQLLCQAANQLQQCLRESDTLARLGGDEFGVLLENCALEPAMQIAENLRKALQDLNFTANGRTFTVSASIGLVCLTPSQFGAAEALQAADMACYLAKEKGHSRIQLYNPDDSELLVRFDEMTWVQQIHRAFEERRFCLYSQDIAAVKERAEPGEHIEVLLRLRDESGRLVSPGEFIPAAERYGLMPLLDRWVVENALGVLAQRHGQTDRPIAICAINLSGATVGDQEFLAFLREQIKRHQLPPGMICFEVTETTAIANLSNAIRFIHELQDLGCRFALDDFGAGMSSFAYLKQLPVDYLKIDGSFVKDMLEDPVDYAMVEMISRLGRLMGKQTIAEFVESDAIFSALGEIGVDYAQGYAIARPQPFFMPDMRGGGAVSENAKSSVFE